MPPTTRTAAITRTDPATNLQTQVLEEVDLHTTTRLSSNGATLELTLEQTILRKVMVASERSQVTLEEPKLSRISLSNILEQAIPRTRTRSIVPKHPVTFDLVSL